MRLNHYDSIKARVRVGRAAMVLCAIPLDAGSFINVINLAAQSHRALAILDYSN